MERLEFIVEIEGWKSLYRARYTGDKEKLLAFTALVEGTTQMKLGAFFPEMKKAVSEQDVSKLEDFVKEINKLAKRVVKAGGIGKDFKKFAEQWAVRELLQAAGLKISPEKREIKAALKKI